MDYIIQKKLNEVLEKLQSRVNQENLNQNLKEEAIKIITKMLKQSGFKDDDIILQGGKSNKLNS